MLEYPIFNLPVMSSSLIIATMGIVHVFIAQFSIGSAFFVAIAERAAMKNNDIDTREFLRKYAYAILLIPYVVGTATGPGIWFVISVINPRVTSTLIHQFVWAWGSEWTFFMVEVAAIYIYFYTWDKVPNRIHNRIAWIFAGSSIFTLLWINGIMSFMLTTGSWVPRGPANFWKAFLNPVFFPTSIIRIFMSIGLAGGFMILLLAISKNVKPHVRNRLTSIAYKMIIPSLICFPIGVWTFLVLPLRSMIFLWGSGFVMTLFSGFGFTVYVVLVGGALIALRKKDFSISIYKAVMFFAFAFVSYGCFEFVREGLRKPYIIENLMYSTGVTTKLAMPYDEYGNITRLQKDGVLSAAPYAIPYEKTVADLSENEKGEAVFMVTCHPCHSYNGYLPMLAYVNGWTYDDLYYFLTNQQRVKPVMPPFPGTEDEKAALASYLESLAKVKVK